METLLPADHWYSSDRILLLDLSGEISMADSEGLFGRTTPGTLVELKDRLMAAEKNDRIKAVILKIDSPGGSVTASDAIFHELMEFKKKMEIPIIAIMGDTAASGGLYVAMAADQIYAMPTTVTGSIGVITLLPGLKGLSEKVGFEMRVIKSAENKDLGSPWRDLSESERKIFQSLIDEMYDRFQEIIVQSRGKKGLTREKLKEFADGRVFDGPAAVKYGLVDGVMYFDDVIKQAKKSANLSDAAVVSYEYPGGYRGNVYARGSAPKPQAGFGASEVNLFKMDLGLKSAWPSGARFLYMWVP